MTLTGALVLLCGCRVSETRQQVVVRDSAGVSIIESLGPLWTPETTWAIQSSPLIDLGRTGSGSMHEFYDVDDAAFLAGGSLVVADRGSSQVRFYDRDGHFSGAVGAAGDGPGEFRQLLDVASYRTDSVLTYDPRLRRATILSASGSLGRVVSFDLPHNTVTEPVDHLFVLDTAGFLLSVTVMPRELPPGILTIGQLILRYSVTGGLQDTVAVLRGFEIFRGPSAFVPPPFGKLSLAATYRDEVFTCEGEYAQYAVRGLDGELRRVVRLRALSLAVPKQVLDSVRDVLSRRNESSRGMARALLPTYPFCSGILVDRHGYVWVESYHHPTRLSGEPRTWLVFSPRGEWLGRLDLPPNFEAFEVGESEVLGMARDSMEVETVQVLALKRR